MGRLRYYWIISVFIGVSLAEYNIGSPDSSEINNNELNFDAMDKVEPILDDISVLNVMDDDISVLDLMDNNDQMNENEQVKEEETEDDDDIIDDNDDKREEYIETRKIDSVRLEIENNIEDLLKQGFKTADTIVKSRQLAIKMRSKSSMRKSVAASFHFKEADPNTIHLSECKALGMLETSKLIVEKYKVSRPDIGNLLNSIRIPDNLCKAIDNRCDELRSTRLLNSADMPDDKTNCNDPFHNSYRSSNGECNNRVHTSYGKGGIPFCRHIHADYFDGVSVPRGGGTLPNPRKISVAIGVDNIPKQSKPKIITQMLKLWGQFLDHDIVMTPEFPIPDCCRDGKVTSNPDVECHPIDVTQDPFYSKYHQNCIRFIRSLAFTPCKKCKVGKREQVNEVTAFIDGSNVYGSTYNKSMRLRSKIGGKLKVHKRGEEGSCASSCRYAFLPTSHNVGEKDQDKDAPFGTGDVRANEQPGLTSMHTIFVRYHNLLAEKIAEHRPDLNDNDLYQETRKIVGAVMQHITYTEFLPIILGRNFYTRSGLYTHRYFTYYNGYNGNKYNPSVCNVFGIAYRFGHSLIAEDMKGIDNFKLVGNFFNSHILLNKDKFPSHVIEGECELGSEQVDISLTKSITNKLFTKHGDNLNFGLDLMALNIMRGRDHGIPTYNKWRQFCNLKPFSSFKSLLAAKVMPTNVVKAFSKVYKGKINDIDLFPAGLAEFRVHGGFVGPTFACILSKQFLNLKYGDRFWYEDGKTGFHRRTMIALKKTTLSAVFCDTTSIDSMQKYVMVNGTHPSNLRRPCSEIVKYYSLLEPNRIRDIANEIPRH